MMGTITVARRQRRAQCALRFCAVLAILAIGSSRDGIFGACPGAPGRVRLSYYPEGKPDQIRHADWKTTAAATDFTAQWRLEGLAADPRAFTKELMRFKWVRKFSLPVNRAFYSRTTSYFIKDDHDTLANDCWPGRSYGAVSFAEGVSLCNDEQFPSRDPRYAHVRWGRDLEIWPLEGRDYRSAHTDPDGPEKTILGARQKAWLFEALEQSAARFKIVFSPTPIVGPDRAAKADNHANEIFAWEGAELRRRLGAIPGVIVLCGDRHWQYASVEPETGLWEFVGRAAKSMNSAGSRGTSGPSTGFCGSRGAFCRGASPTRPRSSRRSRSATAM